jgi:RNA polymerase sigma-70 factor (ECF subfamily)
MPQSEFDDPAFLERLRQGDSAAYRTLIRRFHGSLTSVAASVIGSRAQAEEVVQDAWLAVFSSIARFEGRSSVVTWLFSIVLNRARTRVSREGRLVALPSLMDGTPPNERAVPTSAFRPDGHWIDPPRLWDEVSPERIIGGRQLWQHVREAIDRLPAGQRAVITLRDMEGRTAEEACALLALTPENQRVLLHRARGQIRQLVDILTGDAAAPAPVARSAAAARRRARDARGLTSLLIPARWRPLLNLWRLVRRIAAVWPASGNPVAAAR